MEYYLSRSKIINEICNLKYPVKGCFGAVASLTGLLRFLPLLAGTVGFAPATGAGVVFLLLISEVPSCILSSVFTGDLP